LSKVEVKPSRRLVELPSDEADTAQTTNQQFAAIGELHAGISHESRNLLSGILSFAQVGQRRQSDPAKMVEIFARIEKEALRCIDLHTSVLEHVRMDGEHSPDDSTKEANAVDIGEPIVSAVRLVKHQMQMKHQTLIVETESEEFLVSFSGASLRQVLLNLLLNAMQATPDGGTIRIAIAAIAGDLVCISIEDSGPGVAEDDRESVFESLFTTKQGGTGLGLAITRQLVVANRGSIEVGESVLGGARFDIVIPRSTGGA
tara:strand:+ start:38702 stop:39478 length:777 start_codon:yes stop_codon:yes gene_type:complete